MWSLSINDKDYLANIIFVKTQSFGPHWEPHQLTIYVCIYIYRERDRERERERERDTYIYREREKERER